MSTLQKSEIPGGKLLVTDTVLEADDAGRVLKRWEIPANHGRVDAIAGDELLIPYLVSPMCSGKPEQYHWRRVWFSVKPDGTFRVVESPDPERRAEWARADPERRAEWARTVILEFAAVALAPWIPWWTFSAREWPTAWVAKVEKPSLIYVTCANTGEFTGSAYVGCWRYRDLDTHATRTLMYNGPCT